MNARSVALLVPALLLALTPVMEAQRRGGRGGGRPGGPQGPVHPPVTGQHRVPRPVPPAQIVFPSGPAALAIPHPFEGLRPGRRDLYRLPSGRDRFQHLDPRLAQIPLFIGGGDYFPWPYYPDPAYMGLDSYRLALPEPVDVRGSLSLLTTPPSAQVFVDGFYSGLAGDFGFNGWPMSVAAGAHQVELRAPGYETLSFNVMIEPNEILRYRGDMRLSQPAAAAAAATTPPQPRVAKTYYVIPKCYAGDRPPRGPLPPGCDRRNLQTVR